MCFSDDFLNNSLNFNYFWNLNHLFNDFIDLNSDLFNSFNISWYLDNLLFDIFDWFGNLNKVIDEFFHFDNLRLMNNYWISQIHLFNYRPFNSLNYWLFDNFSNYFDNFMNYWNLDNLFNLNWYLFNDLN